MEKLCGTCSKETGMPKELRIELALSREPNVVYTCPRCKAEHSYQVNQRKKVQAEVSIPQEVEKPKKTKKKKENEHEQLQLEFF
jgi:RNase P subunit RPR2